MKPEEVALVGEVTDPLLKSSGSSVVLVPHLERKVPALIRLIKILKINCFVLQAKKFLMTMFSWTC